jgi:DNA-directed RNA polymerase subunit RPC12/RpoP
MRMLNKGSTVREPGEALCEGCSSRRILMVRAVDALPDNLMDIRAKRMPRNVGKGAVA